jgi:hypothetical protein
MQLLERIVRTYIAADLGQMQDPSALCIVDRADLLWDVRDPVTWQCKRETRFEIRFLERMKLRTPYPQVVERIREVAMNPALTGPRTLVVDATGVGAPVVDLLRAAKIDCEIVAVAITGGANAGTSQRGLIRSVPKRDLIVGLQLMFETGQLRIARALRGAEMLHNELMGMRVRISASGHDSYGSGREGQHDDLVLALALACWRAKEPSQWNWFGGRPDHMG